jgi:tRNA 2-thiocytidine biosynthesis protein TtcA
VVIRPLAYVRERDLARYAELMQLDHPRNLCGSQGICSDADYEMLRDWDGVSRPRRVYLQRAGRGSSVALMDRQLFDFSAVRTSGRAEPDGDIGFDVDSELERAADGAAVLSAPIAMSRTSYQATDD